MRTSLTQSIWYFLSTVFLALVLAGPASAQTDKQIMRIRAAVPAINENAPEYTRIVRDVEGIALEGTEATYFHLAGNLKKITTKSFGETYRAAGEFYYEGGELIFAFMRNDQYDVSIGSNPPPKVVRTEEQRFYFAGGEMIRLLVGSKELKPDIERYAELKESVVEISGKLRDADRQ